MELVFKLFASSLVWSLSMLGCVAPMYVPTLCNAYNSLMPLVVGSIFLLGSIAYVDPDIVETASFDLLGVQIMIFPVAYACYAIGYLFVLGLEMIAYWINHRTDTKDKVTPTIDKPVVVVEKNQNETDDTKEVKRPTTVVMLYLILSFHALLEGVSLGLAREQAWTTLMAIVAHKTVSSLVLSVELHHHSNDISRLMSSILVFASMTPLGILLGAHAAVVGTNDLVQGVSTILVAGTLLHMLSMDVLLSSKQSAQCLQYGAVVMFVAFCGVWIVMQE
ncbi:hypothetical protein AeMF1_009633 [Aphanomyces euteiches]|nr:hypothetical protein AeMF1_009633 [Aphanomyces euteiches]KAH9185154.1 hypothetical protein AeNC1_012868 [Aphanomyces euteiches]